jgi:MFS family permease
MKLTDLSRNTLAPPRSSLIQFRLSLLQFLIYAAPGAVVPIFSLRLKELGFSPLMIGLCSCTQAIGSLIAPLLAGQIADRWVPAQRCITVLAMVEALLLWVLGGLTQPWAVFGVSLVWWLALSPALTLSTALCFAHLPRPGQQFGRVRLWGTIGWVAPGWLLGMWLADASWLHAIIPWPSHGTYADAFHFAAILACGFAVYSLTLPHTEPQRRGGGFFAPFSAIRLLWGRAFAVYAVCTFGICLVLPFHTQASPLLLAELGVSPSWLPRVLTIAQVSEIATLAILPYLLMRFRTRGVMLLGLTAILTTLSALAVGRPFAIVCAGLACYGLSISCYLVAGQMYLNHRVGEQVRASAQSLHSWLCGLGLLLGNLLVGLVRHVFSEASRPSFAVGAVLSFVLLGVFWFGFPKAERKSSSTH